MSLERGEEEKVFIDDQRDYPYGRGLGGWAEVGSFHVSRHGGNVADLGRLAGHKKKTNGWHR